MYIMYVLNQGLGVLGAGAVDAAARWQNARGASPRLAPEVSSDPEYPQPSINTDPRRPISLLRLSLLRFVDSNLPGDSLST